MPRKLTHQQRGAQRQGQGMLSPEWNRARPVGGILGWQKEWMARGGQRGESCSSSDPKTLLIITQSEDLFPGAQCPNTQENYRLISKFWGMTIISYSTLKTLWKRCHRWRTTWLHGHTSHHTHAGEQTSPPSGPWEHLFSSQPLLSTTTPIDLKGHPSRTPSTHC